MEKEFVPYEIALTLKELGFNKKCFLVVSYVGNLYFCNGDYAMYETNKGKYKNIKYEHSIPEKYTDLKIPTFSQVFRWFREKYNLHSTILFNDVKNNYDFIYGKRIGGSMLGTSQTYEEAELECLKKLIEIIKKINNE